MWVANACIIAQLTVVAFRYTANFTVWSAHGCLSATKASTSSPGFLSAAALFGRRHGRHSSQDLCSRHAHREFFREACAVADLDDVVTFDQLLRAGFIHQA